MSSLARCLCRLCRMEFDARWGGGFRYADRFCPDCGAWRCLQYSEDPGTWEAFQNLNLTIQSLPGPLHERQQHIARAAAELDARVQNALGRCPCGGSFTEERPRCPGCGSDNLETAGQVLMDYD